jgi:hypothetical protein
MEPQVNLALVIGNQQIKISLLEEQCRILEEENRLLKAKLDPPDASQEGSNGPTG